MPAVCVYGDNAGGAIIATGDVLVHGKKVALVGDTVSSHGKAPHSAATMVQGSSNFFINGKAVVRTGDAASCGHTATSSITDFFVG